MFCMDCHRFGVEVETIRLPTWESAEVCVDRAACKAARAAAKAEREAKARR